MTYRRLIVVWLGPPIFTTLIVPLVFATMFSILNYLTGGYTILCCTLSWWLYYGVNTALLPRLASSSASLVKAQQKNAIRLPITAIVTSCLVIRALDNISLLGRRRRRDSSVISVTNDSHILYRITTMMNIIMNDGDIIKTLVSMAIGMILLGLIVVLRYIGPQSIGKYQLFEKENLNVGKNEKQDLSLWEALSLSL